MRRIDDRFTDRFQAMEGFEAWHVFDCGGEEVLWVAFVRVRIAAAAIGEPGVPIRLGGLRDFGLERRLAPARGADRLPCAGGAARTRARVNRAGRAPAQVSAAFGSTPSC